MTEKTTNTTAKLIVAWSDNQQELVHIDQVERGLACNCTCLKCKSQLVAKKGPKTVHHFAHHNRQECTGAWETALHQYAKKVLLERKTITVPKIVIRRPNRAKYIVKPEWVYTFEEVQIEYSMGDFQPDAFVSNPHEIFVEFAVTHFCEPDKCEKIKHADISTIEVDLSCTPQQLSLKELGDYILHEAPRIWIHCRRYKQELEKIIQREREDQRRAAEESARRAKEQEDQNMLIMSKLSGQIIDVFEASFKKPGEIPYRWNYTHNIMEARLEKCVGSKVAGYQCFQVEPAYWQAAIIDAFILKAIREGNRRDTRFSVPDVYHWLIKAGFLAPCFPVYYEHDYTMGFVRSYRSEIEGPCTGVGQYLAYLKDQKLLWLDKYQHYHISDYHWTLNKYQQAVPTKQKNTNQSYRQPW